MDRKSKVKRISRNQNALRYRTAITTTTNKTMTNTFDAFITLLSLYSLLITYLSICYLFIITYLSLIDHLSITYRSLIYHFIINLSPTFNPPTNQLSQHSQPIHTSTNHFHPFIHHFFSTSFLRFASDASLSCASNSSL